MTVIHSLQMQQNKITLYIIKNENIIKLENKRRRNLMKTEIADVFMNPVRQRMIQ